MALTKNNFIWYMANVDTIGGLNDVTAAAEVFAKYGIAVFNVHTAGANLNNLKETIRMAKLINTNFKAFGYTNLGLAANYAAWQATVDTWVTNLSSLLTGIFIDAFGFENATATRANQISAVTYVHTAGLSAMVNSLDPQDALGVFDGVSNSVLGLSPSIKDYLLLDNFYFNKANLNPLTQEVPAHMYSRIRYTKGAKTVGVLNLDIIANVGAGDLDIDSGAYSFIQNLISQYTITLIGVSPYDNGSTTHKYFISTQANVYEA